MKERPILFSNDMVRAILDGRKTQTRRMATLRSQAHIKIMARAMVADDKKTRAGYAGWMRVGCQHGVVGDRLWVRETWAPTESGTIIYRADARSPLGEEVAAAHESTTGRWHPSIHMKRRDSRILLEITDVRLEPLREITVADAKSEGVFQFPPDDENRGGMWFDYENTRGCYDSARGSFASLWRKINGATSWAENPFVWALTFRVR